MSARIENGVVLSGQECAILWQRAQLGPLRIAARANDERFYGVLLDLYNAGTLWAASVNGKAATETTESENAEERWVTPEYIAKRAGVTVRTIRNEITRGALPATKHNRFWTISPGAAQTYLASRHAA